MKSLVTLHGKKRVKERTDYNSRIITLAKIVSKNGLSKGMYKGEFHNYLEKKASKGCLVKVYQNNIYILAKNSRRLITTYQIPEHFLPIEQYKLSDKNIRIMNSIGNRNGRHVVVTMKNDLNIKGVIPKYSITDDLEYFAIETIDDIIYLKIDDVIEINSDEEYLNEVIEYIEFE